jgi:small subunit ribosomal protein S7
MLCPHVEVRSRVGGATFQIPMQIRPDRKISWLEVVNTFLFKKKKRKSMAQFSFRMFGCYKKKVLLLRKRMDTHKKWQKV